MEQFISIFLLFVIFYIGAVFFKNNKKSTHIVLKSDAIPEKYINFPVYSGVLHEHPTETLTPKYERLTLFYKGKPDEYYLDSLYMHGFQKASDVRYEKDNTYIICEKIGSLTKIAYHIKKVY